MIEESRLILTDDSRFGYSSDGFVDEDAPRSRSEKSAFL